MFLLLVALQALQEALHKILNWKTQGIHTYCNIEHISHVKWDGIKLSWNETAITEVKVHIHNPQKTNLRTNLFAVSFNACCWMSSCWILRPDAVFIHVLTILLLWTKFLSNYKRRERTHKFKVHNHALEIEVEKVYEFVTGNPWLMHRTVLEAEHRRNQ